MGSLQESDARTKRAALLVNILVSLLTAFAFSSINIALPAIQKEFKIDTVLLSWMITSHLLASAALLVPFGKIGDIYGRKRIFLSGILVYVTSSLLCAVSVSAYMLLAFRTLQGVGSAMIYGTAVAILTSVFPARERGRAIGLSVGSVYLALSLGPFLGGILTDRLGWRSIFLVNVPFGLLAMGLVLSSLRQEWAEAKGERFDLAGSVIYGLTLMAIMYGLSLLPAWRGALVAGIGIAGIFLFIRWESRIDNPVLDVTHFRNNRAFALSNLASLINYSSTTAVTFLMSLYLQYVKGMSAEGAGAILVSQPLVQMVCAPIAGRLSDRIEPRIVASTGMGLTAVCLFVLSFLTETTGLPFIVATLGFLGLGFALFTSPNANAIMSSVEQRFYGVASGTLGTTRNVGQMLSMGVAALVIAVYLGRADISPALFPLFLKSARALFLIFTVLSVGGVFASLSRGNVR